MATTLQAVSRITSHVPHEVPVDEPTTVMSCAGIFDVPVVFDVRFDRYGAHRSCQIWMSALHAGSRLLLGSLYVVLACGVSFPWYRRESDLRTLIQGDFVEDIRRGMSTELLERLDCLAAALDEHDALGVLKAASGLLSPDEYQSLGQFLSQSSIVQ